MSKQHETPEDAEDAYYDALEEGSLERVMAVWSDAGDIACLLPMAPLVRGRQDVQDIYSQLFAATPGIPLTVTHLDWVQAGEIAIHHLEEHVQDTPGGRPAPPFHATNIYRREADGWRLITHLNAPMPPRKPDA
jgi:ketosteroid isomerase-like protein